MRKRVAVLLSNSITNDYRVLKVIQTLGFRCLVDIFFLSEIEEETWEDDNVSFIPIIFKESFKRKILQHSFFCFEFNFFIKEVLKRQVKYDFVIANDLPTLFPAHKIATKLNAKLIYDSHEIYVETINQFFPKKSKGLKAILFTVSMLVMKKHGSFMEKKISKKCFNMFTVNSSIANYFEKKYNLSDVGVIMNFPRITEGIEKENYRQKYNWGEKDKVFLYQGVLNEGRGLWLLIKAMVNTPENYKLVVIGDGVLKDDLLKWVSQNNLVHKIKFIDKVPLNKLPKYTKGADFGVNLLEEINLSKKMASPNKLYEYIHAGIPVLCTETLENNRVLDKYKVGVSVKNSTQAILKGMDYLANDFILEPKTMNQAQNEYSWEKQEGKLLQFLEIEQLK